MTPAASEDNPGPDEHRHHHPRSAAGGRPEPRTDGALGRSIGAASGWALGRHPEAACGCGTDPAPSGGNEPTTESPRTTSNRPDLLDPDLVPAVRPPQSRRRFSKSERQPQSQRRFSKSGRRLPPTWPRPGVLVAVAAGGVLGAAARYEMSTALATAPGSFPLATFAINVSGSLVLGALLAVVIERWRPSEYLRPFFATGFLGAYTTWSTFMVDTDDLLKTGHAAIAAGYVGASLAAGLAAVYVGVAAVRAWRPGFVRRIRRRAG